MKKALKLICGFSIFAFLLASCGGDSSKNNTLEATKKQGFVKCGVSQGLPGFSNADEAGKWSGIDVDVCRAVAAAVLGDASKVKYTPLSAKERFTALQAGDIDVLSRNTTWTLERDAGIGLTFVGVNFYDGQYIDLQLLFITKYVYLQPKFKIILMQSFRGVYSLFF